MDIVGLIKVIASFIYFYVMFASLFGGIYGSYLKIKESAAWKRFKRSSTMARLREKKSQRLADELMS